MVRGLGSDLDNFFSAMILVFSVLILGVFASNVEGARTVAVSDTSFATESRERREASGCTDFLINGHHCPGIPAVCYSVYGNVACRRFCGGCVSPALPTAPQPTSVPGRCEDNLGNGLRCQDLPGICKDSSGIGPKYLCPKFCHSCHEPTTPAATEAALECRDHLRHGLQCANIPGMCSNLYGHLACKRFCDACSGPAPQTTPEVNVDPGMCVDHLGYGLHCQELPGVCHDSSGIGPILLCPKFCQICHSTTTIAATTTTTTAATTTTTTSVIASSTPPSTASPSTTSSTTTTTTPDVSSSTVGLTSAAAASLSSSVVMMTSSPPTDVTTAATPPDVCEDHLVGARACEILESTFTSLCRDANGQKTCARYCGICSDPTTTTAQTSVGLPDTTLPDPCQDLAGDAVCHLPGFCQDHYAHGVCRKTCGLCAEVCVDVINCVGLLGENGTYSSLQELCQEPDRAAICQKTCGC